MHRNAWIVVAVLFAVHLALDVLAMQADSAWMGAAMAGIVVGQLGSIAVWTATARGGLWMRWPLGLLLCIGVWFALVAGLRLSSPYVDLMDSLWMGAMVLAPPMVLVVPLAIVAHFARLSLLPPTVAARASPPADTPRHQFRLLHLFIIMGIVGVLLGVGRIVIPTGPINAYPIEPVVVFVLAVVSIMTLIAIILPSIWAAFRDVDTGMGCALGWIFYIPFVSFFEIALMVGIFGGPPSLNGEAIGIISIFNATQSLSVVATWLALRGVGFRFVRPSKDTGIHFEDLIVADS